MKKVSVWVQWPPKIFAQTWKCFFNMYFSNNVVDIILNATVLQGGQDQILTLAAISNHFPLPPRSVSHSEGAGLILKGRQ